MKKAEKKQNGVTWFCHVHLNDVEKIGACVCVCVHVCVCVCVCVWEREIDR